jgi:hypothetical protein
MSISTTVSLSALVFESMVSKRSSVPAIQVQKCQAVLYLHMLLLFWIALGGDRKITLDLLKHTEMRSVPSRTHWSAREDAGTVAALAQSDGRSGSGSQLDGAALSVSAALWRWS